MTPQDHTASIRAQLDQAWANKDECDRLIAESRELITQARLLPWWRPGRFLLLRRATLLAEASMDLSRKNTRLVNAAATEMLATLVAAHMDNL